MRKKTEMASMFVPEAEQPYQIPHNWRWVNVGKVSTLYRGVSYKKEDAHTIKGEDDILILRGGNIGEGHIDTDNDNVYVNSSLVYQNQIICKYDIVIIGSTGSKTVIGRAGIALENYNDVAFGAFLILVRPAETINPQYLDYYFLSDDYRNRIKRLAKGININNIRADYITRCPVPLPPLAEQQRIVDRIESLFTKLDAARDNAQAVVDGFETRKAAILHRAFSGELMRQWRANNGIPDSERKTVTVASVCHSLKYGTAKKSHKTGKVVVLRMGNLQGGEIDWSNLAYSNDEDDNEKYSLLPGDVLFNRTNSPELVGKTSIYRGEFPAIYAGYLIKLDYNRDIISGEYLNYILNSPEAKEYCKAVKTDGVNQSNINAKRIGAFLIPLPSLNEQEETVKRLQSVLRKQLQVSETAQQVIDNIDAMKKAILGRAFRGELGTNDPSETSPELAISES